jgi:nitrate/TMAO reductase-like tetraheme cytochrome c subunit
VPPGAGARVGTLTALALLVAALGTAAPRALAQRPGAVQCDRCHADRQFLVGKTPNAAGDSALYVPGSILHETRHERVPCAGCHRGFDAGYPHPAQRRVAPCESCHEQAGRDWAASVHAANVGLQGDAPTCVTCHGNHVVYGAADRQSPTYPLNVAALCGRCHADPEIIGTYFATAGKERARTAVAHFFKTVHGTALTDDGLIVSATCNDCHQAHRILPADSAASSVHRAAIPRTCGTCHVGIVEAYDRSAHGAAARSDERSETGEGAPVCVDCHSAHEIVRADAPAWRLEVVEECGACHEHLYETYFDTYHGKVTRLGFLAATCSDCHTPHDMRPLTDTLSSVHPANLVATCARCHPAANANFVAYRPHGDHRDRAKYPVLFWTWLLMTALMAGVFSFFGLHTALWLIRLALDRRKARQPAAPQEQTP